MYDFQSEVDTIFFDEDSVFSEEITGTPAGGSETTLYAVVNRVGPEIARHRGGHEQSFAQVFIHVSKTDWPVATKNKDVFNIMINGTERSMRVVGILNEDDVSFKLALS